jgi:hypothetical protein
MKKRKPYYIIIAALCFATIISIFLPYLKLPERQPVNDGNVLDLEAAVLESHIIDQIAKKEDMDKAVIYDIAKNVIKDKDFEKIVEDLNEEDYYIVDVVSSEIDKMVAELEKVDYFIFLFNYLSKTRYYRFHISDFMCNNNDYATVNSRILYADNKGCEAISCSKDIVFYYCIIILTWFDQF